MAGWNMRRLRAGVTAAALACASLAAVTAPAQAGTAGAAAGQAQADPAVYDQQLDGSDELFLINAANNGGGQPFITSATSLTAVSAYLVSESATGTVDAQIRTSVTDPASAIADTTVNLADLGGTGSGWVTFGFDVALTAGQEYYLVLEASGTAGSVIWNGSQAAVPGALDSWNYDLAYWGGWEEYTGGFDLAFAVNPGGDTACATTNTCFKHIPAADLGVSTAGVMGNGSTVVSVPPEQAYGSHFVAGSDVLALPDGQWRYLPAGASAPVTVAAGDAGANARIAADRAWLASGRVPGRTAAQRAMASRALLDVHVLEQANGAFAAGWEPGWEYNWPRDSSFASVALSVTGHPADAYRILTFTASTQKADGTWDARTLLTGPQVPDDRQSQLDADGWYPWAVWEWTQAAHGHSSARQLQAIYPAVQRAADLAASSLDAQGLPPASPDYWELGTDAPNIGTAAPWLAGLTAAAQLAARMHDRADETAWRAAARRLQAGITATFGTNGYSRTIDGDGRDSAVTFMTAPYNQGSAPVNAAIDSTFSALVQPNGGVIPGTDPSVGWSTSWTPETMFFALAWSASHATAQRSQSLVTWLYRQRTVLGSLPEQVSSDGVPESVAPLGWTDALTLMTLTQLGGRKIPVAKR